MFYRKFDVRAEVRSPNPHLYQVRTKGVRDFLVENEEKNSSYYLYSFVGDQFVHVVDTK